MARQSRFASELNALLKETSMSPEGVVRELTKLSFPVPLHTFNYWLRGYFLPRSESAFQIVAILENMFGVTDNRLSNALLQDLSSGASFVPGESVQSELLGFEMPKEMYFSGDVDKVFFRLDLLQR